METLQQQVSGLSVLYCIVSTKTNLLQNRPVKSQRQ